MGSAQLALNPGRSIAPWQNFHRSQLNLTLVIVIQSTAPKVRDQSIVETFYRYFPALSFAGRQTMRLSLRTSHALSSTRRKVPQDNIVLSPIS